MPKKKEPRSGFAAARGLDVHVTEFLAMVAKAGYAAYTLQDKRRALVSFVRWVRDAGSSIRGLDEACITAFLARRSRPRCTYRVSARAALYQFLEHLRITGVVPPRRSASSPTELLVQQYLHHLSTDRGLCARSIEVYAPFVRAFVMAQRLPKRIAFLDALAIRRYVLDRFRNRSVPFVKLLAAALRSFLRFLFLDEAIKVDLSTAVPPVRRWRFAAVPPLLARHEVERVIATADRSTPRGRRAFAMLLLLARLGLRAGEIVALELDDICWPAGEIVVRGKGRRHDRLPLLKDVGEALAAYLRERGPSTSRRVFLRRYAPRVGLSGPTAVCIVARQAVRRAGLQLKGRVGAHVLRHGLATGMIQRGASLAEISQVLRHRSVASTQLYAKVEFEALRSVALPWPSAEASR
jgi:site-specific recombinase XerD